ncbi:conserved hypothetical protein [Desulforamulus reducens MI-1]|uniref:Type II secretion system protein GspF domain-containing protein n=1 Tax=Desulforamulus reducens (strain ATCC BAA-1160 / DSM 100696 / MI-1) TaxID=349161 RepID=A4J327_DESRM|nr:hypothetical protein [Desulforamulus reducens]ABO49480.1 conserved hypothetical protein [Desulforamulus reducens MI-1]
MLKILLLISLFFLFYSWTVGKYPEIKTIKQFLIRIGLPLIISISFFVLFTMFFMTPLSGALMAVLGWHLPGWLREKNEYRKLKKHRDQAKNFITSAGGLYGAGLETPQVLKAIAQSFPEPFASEFQSISARRELDPTTSVPKMLMELADKYNLPEMKAEAAVIAAASTAGGPAAAARGSKRLGKALRLRDELIQERIQATYEPKIASIFVITIIGVGLLLDATAFREYFKDGGQLAMSFSCLIFVGLTLITRRALKVDDIE